MARTRQDRSAGPPHVACIIETSMSYGREVLRGITRYVREEGPWAVYLEQRSLLDPLPPWLKDWDGDGIITRLTPRLKRIVRESGIPTVDLDDQGPGSGLPTVQSDHEAIGAMAADHLLERGFTRFAFFGYPQFEWSRRCREGLGTRVLAAGCELTDYAHAQRVNRGHQQPSWEAEVDSVAEWLRTLPKPIGLVACNDFRGLQAIDACRRAEVAVPEQVAVIGVDNETLACDLAYPPLSSVIPDARRIGYEAAALLHQLMRGDTPRVGALHIPPLGVVTRQSTDVTAIADRRVADAMRFIREHACAGIGIADVVAHVATSRSSLQRSFRAAVGRTIHEVIAGVRLHRVKQLLVDTDLPMTAIAERAGFSHVEYLSSAFRLSTGVTLRDYRRAHGQPAPDPAEVD